jgi:hypothetical protein
MKKRRFPPPSLTRVTVTYLVLLMGCTLGFVPSLGCRRQLVAPSIGDDPLPVPPPPSVTRPPSTDPLPAPVPTAPAPTSGPSDASVAADAGPPPPMPPPPMPVPPMPPPPPMPVPPPVVLPPPPDAAPAEVDAAVGRLAQGLVLWLQMDDPVQSMFARDASGNDNRASLRGLDPGRAWVPGRIGGALDLQAGDGSGHGQLVVDNSSSLNRIKSTFTLAVWIFRPTDRHGTIVARRTMGGGAIYQVEIGAGDALEVLINEASGQRLLLSTEAKVPANRFVHLAVTCDGKAIRMYLDGQVVANAPYTTPLMSTGTPLLIAPDLRADPQAPLFPRVDDLRLYDRALSGDEVSALALGQQ